jgi:nucleotide-binding universal stress UspA family protein
MFHTILVPLDGSELAECVLPHAVAIARPFNAEIAFLRLLERNRASAPAQVFDLLNWQINKTNAELYLEKIRARLQEENLRLRTAVLEGLVAEGITEYAESQGMNLIIISSHGRNGITRWGISSVTQKIILSAPTSVLIVRARQQRDPSTALYRNILMPLDGSQRAENVLPLVAELARFHGATIHIVHVVQTPEMARQMPPAPEDINLCNTVIARNRAEAENYLKQVSLRSYLEGIEVRTHLLTSDNAAVALHQLAEQEHAELVTLSAHGYSGNHQWPYGSMVTNFILYGKGSLLIVQDQLARHETSPQIPTAMKRSEY